MELVHGLPGTTFSNVMQRGRYASDKAACLALAELERWLAVVESFNGRLRDECLNTHWFLSLEDARAKIEAWRATTTRAVLTHRLAG